MNFKFLSLFCLLFLITSCGFYHDADFSPRSPLAYGGPGGQIDPSMPQVPGKCYAKCKMSGAGEKVISVVETYEADVTIEESILKSREVAPAEEKWVKKRADKNCLSADPNDCLVWCLVKTDPVYDKRWVEIDSSGEKHLQVVYSQYEVPDTEGLTQWKEVVCHGDLTPSLISEIRVALIDRGYEAGVGKKADDDFKQALLKFQDDNNLPYGQMDVETLSALGVFY